MTVLDIMNEAKEKKEMERRRYLRLPVELPCCLKFWKENGGAEKERVSLFGKILNLSEGGVCLETPSMTYRSRSVLAKRENNLKVIFQLTFPSELINSHADVAWSKNVSRTKDLVGLKFVRIPKEDQDKIVLNIINQIVERNLRNSAQA